MADNRFNSSSELLAEQFKFTIEMSQEAVFWLEHNGQFSYVNDQACRSLGYTREELLALFLWDVDPDFPRERWEQHWANLKTDRKITIETRHRRKDGHIFPVEVSACQVTFGGEEFHAAFVRDITQRRQAADALSKSELLYRSLFEYVPDGILVADQKSVYLDANPMMCKMLGYSREELIGLHASDIVSPHEVEHIEPALAQIQEELEHSRVWQFRRKDDSIFAAEVRVSSMPDGNLLALVRDITERNALEEQLRQAQKMESIGQLAGGIAHDFNNLLLPIIGYSELGMKKLTPADKLYSNLQRVHESANRAAGLTRQILAFSRKQVMDMRVLDLNAVIADFQSMLERLIGEDIEIRTYYEPNLCLVEADKGQMEQVLLNFAVNARDAMPSGGKLTIETANVYLDEKYVVKHVGTLQAGQYVMLVVSDTGRGMDAETQSRIFEPFFTTKSLGEGTGLGLSTSYGIVKQHKGNIWVYSEPGKGTSFKVYLPKAESAGQASAEIIETKTSFLGTGTILVVEDEENTRKFICETLESYGYRAIEAESPSDALDFLSCAANKVDLLLTDVIMPGLNGRELYRKASAIRTDLKVLYMSGYTDNVIVHHGILEEGVNFLQKPFSIQVFVQKVSQLLS